MINIAIAIGLGLAVMAGVTLWLGPIAAVLPAIFVTGLALFVLARRTGRQVEAALVPLQDLLVNRKVDEARAVLRKVKADYGRWQLLISSQIDAQLGMLEYATGKFDDALPLLEAGKWRNWSALTCIACIHWRRKRLPEAWAAFGEAATAAPAQVVIYEVWAMLATRSGDRDGALAAVAQGLKANAGNAALEKLQKTVANKQKLDPAKLSDGWHQFFPEELAQQQLQQQLIRGRRGPQPQPPGRGSQAGTASWRRR